MGPRLGRGFGRNPDTPWVCPRACEAVIDPGASVFRLSAGQISRRIRAATKMAGLGGGFSAHSPRTADGVISSGVRTVELAVRTTGLLNAGRKHRPIVFA